MQCFLLTLKMTLPNSKGFFNNTLETILLKRNNIKLIQLLFNGGTLKSNYDFKLQLHQNSNKSVP